MDIFHELTMTLKYEHWAETWLGQSDEAFIDEFYNKLKLLIGNLWLLWAVFSMKIVSKC